MLSSLGLLGESMRYVGYLAAHAARRLCMSHLDPAYMKFGKIIINQTSNAFHASLGGSRGMISLSQLPILTALS
jgi:hypothetical protein